MANFNRQVYEISDCKYCFKGGVIWMEYSFFRLPQLCIYGQGSFQEVGIQTSKFGKTALLVSDPVIEKMGYVDECRKYLEDAGVTVFIYTNIDSEPTDVHVEEALKICRENNCDVIVALGGGSCLDTAKAVAVMMNNDGYIGDYMGGKKAITNAPLPLICLPTTAGTGSEVTDVTVITNTSEDIKMMIKNPAFLPKVAIVDPYLSKTAPPKVTAATGIDALCHAIESYISRRSQPMTDTLALSAIEKIVNNIETAYNNGSDMHAREQLALAAMEAGAAFSNASVCLVHGMSRPIGALFHVPHGISNAMLLPAVLEFSKDHCKERLAVIGRLIDKKLEQVNDEDAANETIEKIKQLCKNLNIPNLKDYGIDEKQFEEHLGKMADDAIASGSPGNNPRIPTKEEIIELYRYCYNYQF